MKFFEIDLPDSKNMKKLRMTHALRLPVIRNHLLRWIFNLLRQERVGCRLSLSCHRRKVIQMKSRRMWRCPTRKCQRIQPTCLSNLCSCDWKQKQKKPYNIKIQRLKVMLLRGMLKGPGLKSSGLYNMERTVSLPPTKIMQKD